jgi:hypothetical protein
MIGKNGLPPIWTDVRTTSARAVAARACPADVQSSAAVHTATTSDLVNIEGSPFGSTTIRALVLFAAHPSERVP